jgi:hypothetical protein
VPISLGEKEGHCFISSFSFSLFCSAQLRRSSQRYENADGFESGEEVNSFYPRTGMHSIQQLYQLQQDFLFFKNKFERNTD